MHILILKESKKAIGASEKDEITLSESGNDLYFGGRWYALLKLEDVFTVEATEGFEYKDGAFYYDEEIGLTEQF